MLPVLRGAAKGVRRIPELADEVAAELQLSFEEQEMLLPSGKQRVLHNRLHWAKFYMTRAGLIDVPTRGKFTISPVGASLLASEPLRIDNELLASYPSFTEFLAASGSPKPVSEPTVLADPDDLTPEERIDEATKALGQLLKSELIERVLQGTPSFFETVIVDLLIAMGYGGSHADAARRIGKSGDGGVDGVISEDRLGLDRIYLQAKRYAPGNVVGRPELQGFVGSLVGLGATKGVFVTTSTFSQGAKDYTKHLAQRVVMIDGAELSSLMIEHDVGVRTSRTIKLRRVDEDYFAQED